MPDPPSLGDLEDLQVPDDRRDAVDEALVREDLRKTARALDAVTPADGEADPAEEVLEMARAYLADAAHFAGEGDLVRALSSVYYAHAWLDAGVRLGVLDVIRDGELFTSEV